MESASVALSGLRAIEDLASGAPVVLVDDTGASGHPSYLVASGELVTAEIMSFVVRHSSGFVRAPASTERLDRLAIPPMTWATRWGDIPRYAVTIDAVDGVSTGISAADRALTIRRLADPEATPDDFTRPGHVVPVRPRRCGEEGADGAAEAALFLAAAARLRPVTVMAELVEDQGNLRDPAGAAEFALRHGLARVTCSEIVRRYGHGRHFGEGLGVACAGAVSTRRAFA